MDYVPSGRKGLFPVGRLDKDTEGLLLITNDGMLAHELLSPARHVEKTYFLRAEGIVTEDDRIRLERGVVAELIDRILVEADGGLEIRFRFADPGALSSDGSC